MNGCFRFSEFASFQSTELLLRMTTLACTSVRRIPGAIFRLHVPGYQFVQRAQYAEKATEVKQASGAELTDEEIGKICDKSRMKQYHARKNKGLFPYADPKNMAQVHQHTLRWQRKQIGLYGFDCKYDPALCFTTKEEMEDMKEYEKVAFDKSIMELRRNALEEIAQEKEEMRKREERVVKALETMNSWKERIREKMIEKQKTAEVAKSERARLLEEVRRFFGYTIDPNDERFQIMLQHKENELLKQKRLEKKQKKEQQFMKQLAALEREGNPGEKGKTEGEDENK